MSDELHKRVKEKIVDVRWDESDVLDNDEVADEIIGIVREAAAKVIGAQLAPPWVSEYTHEEQTGLRIAARLIRGLDPDADVLDVPIDPAGTDGGN